MPCCASDVARKQLAGVPVEKSLGPDFYTVEWNERVYSELARRAAEKLEQGERVIIDANFRKEVQRSMFLDLAALGSASA